MTTLHNEKETRPQGLLNGTQQTYIIHAKGRHELVFMMGDSTKRTVSIMYFKFADQTCSRMRGQRLT